MNYKCRAEGGKIDLFAMVSSQTRNGVVEGVGNKSRVSQDDEIKASRPVIF
jgi:hypothetical protein